MFTRNILLILAVLLLCAAGIATADVFEPGDLVIPGNHVLDNFGGANGCFYRLRNDQVTRWFESTKFRSPSDVLIDGQG